MEPILLAALLLVFALAPAAADDDGASTEPAHVDDTAARTGVGGRGWITTLGEGRSIAFASLVVFPASMIVMSGVAAVLYLVHRRVVDTAITLAVLAVFVAAAFGFVS
ncbi:MAG: hypothetical protein ACOC6J_11875 [Spirochaetota bacterium]